MTYETPPFASLVGWAERLASMKPLEPALYTPEECEVFLQRWIGACRDAARLLTAISPVAESFVEVSQYSLMEVIWREDVSLDLSQDAVKASPQMIGALCAINERTLVTRTFWMVVVRPWRAVHSNFAEHRLLPVVKATLLEQIRTSGKSHCLRDSAWEGVKLIDERTAAEARAIDEEQK